MPGISRISWLVYVSVGYELCNGINYLCNGIIYIYILMSLYICIYIYYE